MAAGVNWVSDQYRDVEYLGDGDDDDDDGGDDDDDGVLVRCPHGGCHTNALSGYGFEGFVSSKALARRHTAHDGHDGQTEKNG